MGVGAGLYMCDVVKKSSRSLSHLLMSSCSVRCSFFSTNKTVWLGRTFPKWPVIIWSGTLDQTQVSQWAHLDVYSPNGS